MNHDLPAEINQYRKTDNNQQATSSLQHFRLDKTFPSLHSDGNPIFLLSDRQVEPEPEVGWSVPKLLEGENLMIWGWI